jgi:tRNA1Val (adenine37-N6)-methyltransferase
VNVANATPAQSSDLELGPLTDDALTSRFRVYQRAAGHRYSIDDVATAWEAATLRPDARRVLDLGTGLGSVSISLADVLPAARITGIEAEGIAFALLEKNVARNGLLARLRIEHGDLRDGALLDRVIAEEGPFDLVTGTPPYFLPHEATPPPDRQKAHARIELRGGIEAYLTAAARAVATGGDVVLCASVRQRARLEAHAPSVGLALRATRDLIPREGTAPLFVLATLRRDAGPALVHPPFVARTAAGERTPMERAVRGFFGLASRASEPPSPRAR